MDMKVLETNDWKQVIRTEWKMKYDLYNGPLWRVKLLPNVNLNRTSGSFKYECVVVFSCCHVITDGMSYQRLFGYLLDFKKKTQRNLPETSSLGFYPCLDYYLDLKPTI